MKRNVKISEKMISAVKANKKVIMTVAVACLFLGALYLNISLNQNKTNIANGAELAEDTYSGGSDEYIETSAEEDYFLKFRTERDVLREKELEYLDEIISASASDDETLKDAKEHKLSLVENMEKEFAIEQTVKAKGFNEAAVTFSGGNVSVVVDKETLENEDVAKILEIVKSETGLSASHIKIIPST